MPRARRPEEATEDLNLVPIMNLVLILIPLLLLSVVFLEITVINVTMPQRSVGPPKDGPLPQRLQLIISKEGFWLMNGDRPIPTIDVCQGRGSQQVTICLKNPDAQEPVDKYDWLSLYNLLMGLKADPHWSEHEQLEIVAGADITFGVLVKAMDATRYQRVPASDPVDAKAGKTFASIEDLNDSHVVMHEKRTDEGMAREPLGLFPLVVLGLPTTQ
jgi:biopolymer transport protein ExbD